MIEKGDMGLIANIWSRAPILSLDQHWQLKVDLCMEEAEVHKWTNRQCPSVWSAALELKEMEISDQWSSMKQGSVKKQCMTLCIGVVTHLGTCICIT